VRAIAAIGVLATACSAWHAQTLPGPVSPRGTPPNHFRAGVAQVDITPPPGVGLAGSGPEGRRSKGYRTRLSARAMVLEDADGERIALVVADLTHISPNLHRLAADRSVARTGIGADRLILSATHTHSGPGHFYAERQYNANSSRVPGYDPRLTEFLVERIAEAVILATDSLHRAVINWDTTSIAGVTWNRSFEAFCLNPEAKKFRDCPRTDTSDREPRAAPDSATLRRAVDPVMLMLRVDRVEPVRAPLGSYAVFAMHPTAIPTLNTLIDGDMHVRITDSLTDYVKARNPSAVHLLANGAEGDAAPDVDRLGCGTPQLGVFDPVPSPRGPGEAVDFLEPTAEEVTGCLDRALGRTEDVVRRIMPQMIALYERLGSGSQPSPSIRRGFTTVWLPGRDGLCGWPEAGSSTAAGAEDMRTRVDGWSWLVVPPSRKLGIEEHGSAVHRRDGECQSPKRPLLGAIQAPVLVGEHGFPEVAQISVVRIGSLWLAALPAELTMTAGRRVLDSLRGAVRAQGDSVSHAALVGLANGFLQYVATREEYQWQSYEGGSTLYGPGTAEMLARQVRDLAAKVAAVGRDSSPDVEVPLITAYPGPPSEILTSFESRAQDSTPRPVEFRCGGGHLVASWTDAAPGRIFPLLGPWLALERREAEQRWERLGEEGDGRLELYADGPAGKGEFRWRVIWRHPRGSAFYRLVRLGARGDTLWTSDSSSTPVRIGCRPS
jgi:neutral ceramidase